MVKGFVLADCDQTKLYEIPSFSGTGLVSHGFSTRIGGVGTAPYDNLNLALHVGDDPAAVVENRKIMCRALGADFERFVTAEQVHGVNIAVVEEEHAGLGAVSYDTALPNTDGIVTNRPGLLLATFYADCVPIFILDPVKKVIGSVHAGWKGTVGRIGEAAVRKMKDVFRCDPADLLVGIGPSIGPCCYEVDAPLIDKLSSEFSWWQDVITETKEGRKFLDLWKTNFKVMTEAGVKTDNIDMAEICTCCNQEMLFSYRGSGGITGRMGAFIMLRSLPEKEGSGVNE